MRTCLLPLMLAAALVGGCQRPADRPASAIAPTAPERPAEPDGTRPAAGEISYRCSDGGTLSVGYGAHDATVGLPDGRRVTLPRAESASRGGGDVYVGEALSLSRQGRHVQLFQDESPRRDCSESPQN